MQVDILSNRSAQTYTKYSYNATAYRGRNVASNNSTYPTNFFIDDVSLQSDE